MICRLTVIDELAVFDVINQAAIAYKGKIPCDLWKEPYMPHEELEEEITSGVQFYGWKESKTLKAVMGIQSVTDVTLIRHAYVLPSEQRKGLGPEAAKIPAEFGGYASDLRWNLEKR